MQVREVITNQNSRLELTDGKAQKESDATNRRNFDHLY
jgi:hypothetical protein